MNAKNGKKKNELGIDMTPMIDVVFQLIIFFMLVSEMSQSEIEDLNLPSASRAVPDKCADRRMVVNILPPAADGLCEIRVRGKRMSLPELRDNLRLEAQLVRSPGRPGVSDLPVLVRADDKAPFRYAQAVMQECVRPGIGIYKLQFAVKEPEKGR